MKQALHIAVKMLCFVKCMSMASHFNILLLAHVVIMEDEHRALNQAICLLWFGLPHSTCAEREIS